MDLTVVATRNGLVEATHPVSAVLVEGGQPRWRAGPDVDTFWRSACKPFQLETSLKCLAPDVVAALDERMLAVGASSHSGQPAHVELVASLLGRFGLSVDGLQCGAHPPAHEASAKLVPVPSALHNNCSGKHTYMLAACAAMGWDADYRPLAHPLQQRNQARLDELAQVRHQAGVDGCSVPTFFGPLRGMALAFSRLAEAMADAPGTLLGRVGWAMQRAPFFVSGDERVDLALTTGASEPLAVKVGAEGLFCVARPARRQGFAVKARSGNADATAVAVRWVLEEAGVSFSSAWPWAVVRNVRGVAVGERLARPG